MNNAEMLIEQLKITLPDAQILIDAPIKGEEVSIISIRTKEISIEVLWLLSRGFEISRIEDPALELFSGPDRIKRTIEDAEHAVLELLGRV